jgi:drug/metabolite transporter (DMT)-like permease
VGVAATKTQRLAGERSLGVVAVVVAFVGLSLGSTIAKSAGSPGVVVAFWRFLIGAVLWHAWIALRGLRSGSARTVDAAAWRAGALPGVVFGINLACFFSGATRTPIAHAEFISALTPLVLIPVAAIVLGERIQRYAVVGGAVALAGISLILSQAPPGGTSLSGDVLVVGAVVAWVVYLMTAKAARATLDTAAFMAVMTTTACLTALPLAVLTGGGFGALTGLTATGWVLVAVLAVTAGTISHGLLTWAQRRVAVGTISILQLAQPGLGVCWAAAFLGESVTPVQLLGMAIVLGAVGMIAWRSAHDGRPRRRARMSRWTASTTWAACTDSVRSRSRWTSPPITRPGKAAWRRSPGG